MYNAEKIVSGLIVLLILLVLWMHKNIVLKNTEHADLAAPNFRGSLVDMGRARMKDSTGMSVNDYALEANLMQDVPLSGNYRVLGFN